MATSAGVGVRSLDDAQVSPGLRLGTTSTCRPSNAGKAAVSVALDLVGQFAGISQRERRIDGQRHLRVEPMTEHLARLHPADALGVLGPRGAAEMAGERKGILRRN